MTTAYTGVGSRATPPEILLLMQDIAIGLSGALTLRSGGAGGADTAFEQGCIAGKGAMAIYLPWRDFNHNGSPLFTVCEKALALAKATHPRWGDLNPGAQKLHARNCYQVVGPNLTEPSDFLVCWTPDGCEATQMRSRKTGGTGTAISIANMFGVPVFNLANPTSRDGLVTLLKTKGITVPGLGPSWVEQSLF